MIQSKNMINSNEANNMWEKYRKDSKQTICIIEVLTLATKLCLADGHFSIEEEEEILKIIPHEKGQKRILTRILEEAAEDPHPITYHAERIKKLIGEDDKDFLEFIIAVLFRLAHSDHIYHVEEDQAIRDVAKIFGVEKTYYQTMAETFKKFFKFKYFERKQDA